MRNFKIFLWIFIVFIIQTVILARVHILGAVPSLIMAYMICVVMLENEFINAVTISIICAGAAGALCGREFVITVLSYVYSAVIVFALRKKPLYIGNAPKALLWTFIASAAMEIVFFAAGHLSINTHMLLYNALPTAVFNTVLAALVYPVLKAVMYKEKKKKLLII